MYLSACCWVYVCVVIGERENRDRDRERRGEKDANTRSAGPMVMHTYTKQYADKYFYASTRLVLKKHLLSYLAYLLRFDHSRTRTLKVKF